MTDTKHPDFNAIFLNGTPIMDTRAPVEFSQGAFQNASNLPLMTDDERTKIGICYKHNGQEAAINLGHKLVSGDIKATRMKQWIEFIENNPEGYLYCFRGGLRSHTVQEWLKDAGYAYPLIPGGYKAMRRFLIDELEKQADTRNFVVLSGRTGTGKTRILNQLPGQLDLEGHAHHRGSSFGRHVTEQPTQIDFEHQITIDLMRNKQDKVFVEDESQVIGKVHIPDHFLHKLAASPIIVIEKSLPERIDVVIEDYVIELSKEYSDTYGKDQGFDRYAEYMLAGTDRIRKRLGGALHKEIRQQMVDALAAHKETGDLELHRLWVSNLLNNYYDRMYDYQLSKKQDRVIGRSDGTLDEVEKIAE